MEARSGFGSVLALGLAMVVGAAASPAPAHANLPVWTNPNLNTDGITVAAGAVTEVAAPTVNGVPTWKGTLIDIVMKPSAIWTSVHTRVYVPEGYSPNNAAYPTLYLLHGAGEDLDVARPWNDPSAGNVGVLVDASPFKGIVVMPDGGRSGWYTNWVYADLSNHKLNWQSFHVDQLRGWIDGHFKTNASKAGRAIAGLSMGGHGALSYAAQRTDLFSMAASFSGPGDIEETNFQQGVMANEVTKFASTVPLFGSAITKSEEGDMSKRAADLQTVVGTYGTQAWRIKNPYLQGPKYKSDGVTVSLYSGYGGTSNAGASTLEYVAGIANDRLYNKWKTDGLSARYCTGVGDHSWYYWRNDLSNWLVYAYGDKNPAAACPSGWGAPRP